MTHGASLFFLPLTSKQLFRTSNPVPTLVWCQVMKCDSPAMVHCPPSSCRCYRRGTLNALKVNRVYKRDLNEQTVSAYLSEDIISSLEYRTHKCDLFAPVLLYHSYKLKKKKPQKSKPLKSSFILIMIECQMKPQSCSLLSFIKQNKK